MRNVNKAYMWLIGYIVTWILGVIETSYFGWNLMPKPTAEWALDISLYIAGLVCIFFAVKTYTIYIIESTIEDVFTIVKKKR